MKVISETKLNAMKALLKAFYLGFYAPPVETIQPYFDYPLSDNGESFYKGQNMKVYDIEYFPNHPYGAGFWVKYGNDYGNGGAYWALYTIQKWIED